MRTKSIAQEDSTAAVVPTPRPRSPWRVRSVEALPDFALRVTFNDGLSGIVRMSRLIHSDLAGVFAVLVDPMKFAQVYVKHGAVTWPGEIDLAPDAMHEEIKQRREWVL